MQSHSWITVAIGGLASLLVGCGPAGSSGPSLAVGDFSDPARAGEQRPSRAVAEEALAESGLRAAAPIRYITPDEQDLETFFSVEAVEGHPVVVDSLIGQVNGRPIFADEVLAPLMDRLNAMYRDEPYKAFRERLIGLVIDQLRAVIINELIVAESRASLSSEQQGGLLAFMDSLREDAVRKRGGVKHEAERALLEEEGKTIDEYMDAERQKILIGELLRKKISPFTVVSWRDIEREYRANLKSYQPSATVTLGRIRLRTEGNEAQISLLGEELKAGEPFAVVAEQAGMPDSGVWESFQMPKDGMAGLPLADFYIPHMEGLGPGQTSEAFARGRWTIWVSVIEVNQPPHRSLDDSDVQRQLQRQIAVERGQEEESRFIGQVLQRGIYDDMEMMAERAVGIAASRFPPR
jgi:hypothetical protein